MKDTVTYTMTVVEMHFIFERDWTHCNVFYRDSNGGHGWKTKAYPISTDVRDIIDDETEPFFMWMDGKYQHKSVS